MANAFNLKILGIPELEKKLLKLEQAVQKKIVTKALRNAAKTVRNIAVANVPVDSGKLKNSIKVRSLKRRGRKVVGIEVVTGRRVDLDIDPSDKYYYPAAVEFGTKDIPAHPFLRPALNNHKDRLIKEIGDEIGAGIIKMARKK